MGRFVNPDNHAFKFALNSEIYVDKSGLINYTNRMLCQIRDSSATAVPEDSVNR